MLKANECAQYSDLIKRLTYTKYPPPFCYVICVDIYPENDKS